MEVYLRVFINWKQNHWVKPLSIAEFAYNNAKNGSISHNPFELNYKFYPQVLFKEDVKPYFKSHLANKLVDELRKLIKI